MEGSSSRGGPSAVARAGGLGDVSRYRGEVERYLAKIGSEQAPLSGAVGQTLAAGGKRLRPVIALLTCEAVCGSYDRALPVAAAFELAHSASLVQDDIIDRSETRHGEPAAHKRYGVAGAIMVSDVMIFQIFLELAKYGTSALTPRKMAKLLTLVGEAAKLTADGEFLEVTLSERGSVTEQEYLKVAELKTGSLFAASAACGALVGGGKRSSVDAAYSFGKALGVSFQVRDDVLDIFGSEASTGKPVLKDIQNNASNIVLLYALSKANAYQKQAINSMLYKSWFAMADVEKLLKTLNDLGSIEHATHVANQYADRAKHHLRALPDSEPRRRLAALAEGLGGRSK